LMVTGMVTLQIDNNYVITHSLALG
jgi:hypothetical protein